MSFNVGREEIWALFPGQNTPFIWMGAGNCQEPSGLLTPAPGLTQFQRRAPGCAPAPNAQFQLCCRDSTGMLRRWMAKIEEKDVSCMLLFESKPDSFSALGRRWRSEGAQPVFCYFLFDSGSYILPFVVPKGRKLPVLVKRMEKGGFACAFSAAIHSSLLCLYFDSDCFCNHSIG